MKAMLIKTYGEDAKFEAAEVDKPEVKAGHVLVKIAASSVNTVDTMIRKMGKDLPLSPNAPATLGMDFAGTVDEVGDGVSDYSVGDEVYGCAGGLADLPGTLTEYIVADSKLIALNGQIATTVSMCELDLTPAHFKGLSLHVVFMLIPMLRNFKREQHAEILRKLAEIVESGALKPVLDEKKYSLEEAGEAHTRLESGKGMGKVVVEN